MSIAAVGVGEVSRAARIQAIELEADTAKLDPKAIAAVLAHLASSIIGSEASGAVRHRDTHVDSVSGPKHGHHHGIERHHVAHSARPEQCQRAVHLLLGAPTNVSEARMDYDVARDARRRAQDELQAAIKSGDPHRIRAAQARLRAAEQAEAAALATYNRMVEEADIEKRRLAKEGADRIARALQNLAAEQHRLTDSRPDAKPPAPALIEVHTDGTVIKASSGSKQRLLNADSDVRTAYFQLVNSLRNAD